jgi:predicted amidophosphoribosyltransferase
LAGVKAQDELCCPVCHADIPLGGDERVGDEVFCNYCGAPCVIITKKGEEWDLEEDF